MTTPDRKIFGQLPKPSRTLAFRLLKVEDIYLPHPYCITPKHLEYADSPYLNEVTIARAEERGAQCDICRKRVKAGKQDKVLPMKVHEKQKALFIEVDDNSDLNKIKGLGKYLQKIKPLAEVLGIQGFAFPNRQTAGL